MSELNFPSVLVPLSCCLIQMGFESIMFIRQAVCSKIKNVRAHTSRMIKVVALLGGNHMHKAVVMTAFRNKTCVLKANV